MSVQRVVNPFDRLSPKQTLVARGIALGFERTELAELTQCSIKTCDGHRIRVMNKLGVRNNVELARLAIAEGFVSVPAAAHLCSVCGSTVIVHSVKCPGCAAGVGSKLS